MVTLLVQNVKDIKVPIFHDENVPGLIVLTEGIPAQLRYSGGIEQIAELGHVQRERLHGNEKTRQKLILQKLGNY